jgi:hypothetical protein
MTTACHGTMNPINYSNKRGLPEHVSTGCPRKVTNQDLCSSELLSGTLCRFSHVMTQFKIACLVNRQLYHTTLVFELGVLYQIKGI